MYKIIFIDPFSCLCAVIDLLIIIHAYVQTTNYSDLLFASKWLLIWSLAYVQNITYWSYLLLLCNCKVIEYSCCLCARVWLL